jgi:DHA1 family bicyclomycin/chloramphenicol resistance-like MFS transporter
MGIGNGLALPGSNAGLVSVRPHLAGSASGLGGALQMGLSGAAASLASALLQPGGTAMPMLLVMFGCALGGLLAGLTVLQRQPGHD